MKKWYSVLAPQHFENKEIGEVVSADENNLLNRVVSVSLAELSGQYSQNSLFTSLNFKIKDVKGRNAYSELVGHEISNSYVRTLVRRNRSLVNVVHDISTRDGKKVRLKLIAVSAAKLSETMRKNLYHAIMEELRKLDGEVDYYQLMDEVIFGKLAMKLFSKLSKITAMYRVEVRKSELLENA